MFYQFATASFSPNPCITHTVNNIDLIITFNKENKDWIKKYHKMIQKLKTITDIQLQIHNIIKLADAANNQLADTKTILLQTRETHKIQIGRDIFEELRSIIYGDMK